MPAITVPTLPYSVLSRPRLLIARGCRKVLRYLVSAEKSQILIGGLDEDIARLDEHVQRKAQKASYKRDIRYRAHRSRTRLQSRSTRAGRQRRSEDRSNPATSKTSSQSRRYEGGEGRESRGPVPTVTVYRIVSYRERQSTGTTRSSNLREHRIVSDKPSPSRSRSKKHCDRRASRSSDPLPDSRHSQRSHHSEAALMSGALRSAASPRPTSPPHYSGFSYVEPRRPASRLASVSRSQSPRDRHEPMNEADQHWREVERRERREAARGSEVSEASDIDISSTSNNIGVGRRSSPARRPNEESGNDQSPGDAFFRGSKAPRWNVGQD